MKNVDVSPEKELLRKFLHIKDEYHITDSAIKVMHDFFRDTKVPFYSMGEVARVQRKTNHTIPLQYAKDFAYVPFEFALRAAVFVANKFRSNLRKLNHLPFRLNMDGTSMGNKHVVAIRGQNRPISYRPGLLMTGYEPLQPACACYSFS